MNNICAYTAEFCDDDYYLLHQLARRADGVDEAVGGGVGQRGEVAEEKNTF